MNRLIASVTLALIAAAPHASSQEAQPDAAAPDQLFLPSAEGTLYASELIGMEVYSSATDYAAEYGEGGSVVATDARSAWDDIGEINDIALSPEGDVLGVLVDVGGFLGLGARTVGLAMPQVHVLTDAEGERFAAVTSSRDALMAAPEYPTADQMDEAAPGDASTDPRIFAETAASSNWFEIESSRLALGRSANEDIRAFAEHMIEDHTAAGEKMQAAAESDGVMPPPAMSEKEQAKLDELQSAEGEAFDQAYLTAQAAAHDEAVALFTAFSINGPESALREFAAATLPTLEEHQTSVRRLAAPK